MAMQLQPIQLAATSIRVNVLTARELLGLHEEIRGVSHGVALRQYAGECGVSVWLEGSAKRIAARVAALESRLRCAPIGDRAELEDALQTSRTTLVLLGRGLERSPGKARRLAAQSAPDGLQPHLRLVG
jgi:hypothetical protein